MEGRCIESLSMHSATLSGVAAHILSAHCSQPDLTWKTIQIEFGEPNILFLITTFYSSEPCKTV